MGVWIDKVIDRLDRQQVWPKGRYKKVSEELGLYIAFRESNRGRLKEDADWEDADRYYQIDPLAPKISDAFASLLYGRRPTLTPKAESDAKRLDEIAEENGFPALLQRAVRTSSSEGEVWWRAKIDKELADVPIIEWHSRTSVYPLWIGPRLAAAAFVSRYDTDDVSDHPTAVVYRHFEIHERGEVVNVLYEGTKGTLGSRVELTAFGEVAELTEVWQHDLPGMICGRIPNVEGVDPTLGVSDYYRIKDMLHDLNEALTIGAENARMTLKQRMIAPASAFDKEGNLRDQEVWSSDSLDAEMPDEGPRGAPFRVLEYDFKAEQIIEWRRGLAEDALGRIGIVPQFVGAGSTQEGLAQSGTALKVRLIPTTAAGEERGQFWDDRRGGLPGILTCVQMLDTLPLEDGGFGVKWVDAETPPAVERGSTLPEDETEVIDRNSVAVSGNIRSRQVAVEEQHPDWSDDQVREELVRIRKDMQDSQPLTGFLNNHDRRGDNLSEEDENDEEGADEGDSAADEAERQTA